MLEPEKNNGTQVNAEKAKLSPQYENWYEANNQNSTMEMRVRLLRDEIFEGYTSSSGRNFKDILLTVEELAEKGHYVFDQKDVNEYESEKASQTRRRTLRKGEMFEPKPNLADIIPSSQREDREEGLNRSSYQNMLRREVHKYLITSGLSPRESLALLGKATQLANDETWIDPNEWDDPSLITSEEADLEIARIMGEKLGVNDKDLLEHSRKVAKINPSAPTYMYTHDQHSVSYSQGGLSQRPIDIASHWFEHAMVATDAEEALCILLAQEEFAETDDPALKRLIDLTFFAYQSNSLAAELLRHSIPLYPSLSTKYILEKREDICDRAKDIIDRSVQLDHKGNLNILDQQDSETLVDLADRISKNKGSLEAEYEEEIYSAKEVTALEKLEFAVELLDRDNAINRLRSSLDLLNRIDKQSIPKNETRQISKLIKRLEKGQSALYLHQLSEDEYKALLSLQDALDEDILLDIAVPTKIKNVRPAWRYRLDLVSMEDILINPYDDRGLELRMLLDVLQEPVFNRMFLTGPPPRRGKFTREHLLDPRLSDKIYGDLRCVDVLEGIVANNALNEYYKSFGVEKKSELLDSMFPLKEHEQPPSALQNTDKAAKMVLESILNEKNIATIGDCDQDGFFASINWRWTLEHAGVKEIKQKFNTRLEGHAVQPVDLLNLVLAGSELVIINDTGSSEKDSDTFKLIKEGARDIDDILFFRKNIEHIASFNTLTEHEKKQIKSKLTRFINEHKEDEDIDLEELLDTPFTTGRLIPQPVAEFSLGELIDDDFQDDDFAEQDFTFVKEYKSLREYEPLLNFVKGFSDLKIIVCDHHTPSIEATKYFKNNPDAIMVNPEWVRYGYEDIFIEEMKEALVPDSNGEIDIKKVDKIQRKYVCYPESDIVGTVTAGKVMKRFMQLLSDNEIVKSTDEQLYSLDKEKRMLKYREIAKLVSNVTLYEKEGSVEGLPSYFSFDYGDDAKVNLFFGDLWLEYNCMEKIEKRITHVTNSLTKRIKSIKKSKSRQEQMELLKELERMWPISIPDKEEFLDLIINDQLSLHNSERSTNGRINRAMDQIHTVFKERIQELQVNQKLSDSELRFYLEYAGQLPKSFFEMGRHEKEQYIYPYLRKLVKEIKECSRLKGNEAFFKVDLGPLLKDIVGEGGNLRDVKKHLFDLIEEGYEKSGGIPANPLTGKVPKSRSKARYEGNKIWDSAIDNLLESGEFTPMILRSIESFLDYGPYGLEFLKLTEATATLGDGGSVGLKDGLENRVIVKNGMESIEAFVDDYWEASDVEKKSLKRIQPEMFRLVRTALRGTHLKSVNWHLSRLFTHSLAAFVNAMYRRGKDERSQRAKEFWTEAADFCVRRSDNENTRRHRHTLVHAQEVSIERREELFEGLVKELESDLEELEKPIIIAELEGIKYVDPIKGMRGLIAGQLADRYGKPVMVVVEEKPEKLGVPGRYSVSFRLPAKGNIASDMVQLQLAMNPVDGIEVIAHGGHPEAAGGTWEVLGGLETLHEVLDPIFENFEIENPDAGVVKIEEVINDSLENLKDDNWSYLEDYKEYINSFDVADAIAAHMYRQTNPYGVDMPGLTLEYGNLTVVKKSKGKKNDGEEYCCVEVRDPRGNVKSMRLFKNLADWDEIEKGDVVKLRVQPIMRLSALEEGALRYKWPRPDTPDEVMTVDTVAGQKTKPHLDIERIVSVKSAT